MERRTKSTRRALRRKNGNVSSVSLRDMLVYAKCAQYIGETIEDNDENNESIHFLLKICARFELVYIFNFLSQASWLPRFITMNPLNMDEQVTASVAHFNSLRFFYMRRVSCILIDYFLIKTSTDCIIEEEGEAFNRKIIWRGEKMQIRATYS